MKLKKQYGDLWNRIRYLIGSISKNSDDYDEKYLKIRPDLYDILALNKTIEIPIVTIVVRAIFYEDNKCYPPVFLDESLYKIQKCYIIIELTFLKKLLL